MTDQRLTPAEALAALTDGKKVERRIELSHAAWSGFFTADTGKEWDSNYFCEIHADGRYLYRLKVEKVERLRCWVAARNGEPIACYETDGMARIEIQRSDRRDEYRVVPMVEDVPLRVTWERLKSAWNVGDYASSVKAKAMLAALRSLGLTVEVEG